MLAILDMLIVGFAVGLTGALVPGPMLFVTIEGSLKNGWRAGPKVVLGHALIELFVCILIVLGFTSLIGDAEMSVISLVGGVVLVAFGLLTIIQARNPALDCVKSDTVISNSVFAGVLTSASNPYFWIWWLAAGSALVLRGLEIGIFAAVMFVFGHWLADLGWFTFVSTSLSKTRNFFTGPVYRGVLACCGLFLMGFGTWFALG
jgi:threonine/homoserine/homoserine lactone efflux protein